MVVVDENAIYVDAIDIIESRIEDDNKFPVVEDNRLKIILKMIFEFIKFMINYLKYNIVNGTKKEKKFL